MIDDTLPHFLRTRDAALASTDRSLRRRWERGEITRVRSGIYVETQQWLAMDADSRYRARVAAASNVVALGTQFSHDSAAALWRLPTIGLWPAHIHVLGGTSSGPRSRTDIRRHSALLDAHPAQINGVAMTSLARTVLDISRTSSFTRAVAMADDAMRAPEKGEFRHTHSVPPVTRDQLLDLLGSSQFSSARVRARRVVEFATGRSGSVGESLSRVQLHGLGIAPPELQVPFFDEDGHIGDADFYWPELDLIGEFDGLVKYRDQRYLRGRLPLDAVIAEKQREDRMRRVVRAFTRWGWATAMDKARLERHLAAHGLLRTR